MHYTIELLIKGDKDVVSYYQSAKERWSEIMKENINPSTLELSKKLTSEQFWFEHNCGGRWVGQEIMVITGITQYYTTAIGFSKNKEKALLVYNALMMSYCSLEIKSITRDIAQSYYLIEEDFNAADF
ncbi:hypothetical protein [Buttiauxella agrestis]|uniref:hypothetical protein n=1 Tax=Buttiauxella agrestis TaxID=82977 RepID=UPI0015611392|nr:hypothetical protein [Buttiauxella agrestis]BCG10894.1 hypothetical protein BADSM9389_35880 [Buttiauxella agrestis]